MNGLLKIKKFKSIGAHTHTHIKTGSVYLEFKLKKIKPSQGQKKK